jgi:hypothetical protein
VSVPRSAPPRRKLALASSIAIAAVGLVVVVGLVFAGLRPSSPDGSLRTEETSTASTTPLATGAGFLTTVDELRAVAAKAAAGTEPWSSAVDALVTEADAAVRREPHPTNPLRVAGTTGAFVDDSADAYTLALAAVVTGTPAYATASARIIDAWATTATRTADTCTNDGSCNTSLVIGRVAPAFVFAADLLRGQPAFDEEHDARFRAWLRDVLLPAASERDNNWGDAGTFLRLAATTYLADRAGFTAAVTTWRHQADLIDEDGSIPEETRRGREGLQYSQEALLYKVASARIAEREGVDLWGYRGAGGGTLESALDLVAAAFEQPDGWRWHDDVDVPSPAPVWELAAAHWDKPAYADLAAAGRPFGPDGHSAIRWTTIAGGAPSA